MASVEMHGDKMLLKCTYDQGQLAKELPERKWNPYLKGWEYPLDPKILYMIQLTFPKLKVDERILDHVRSHVREKVQKKWTEMQVEPIEPMPIRTKPFKHQIAGYNRGLVSPAVALLMEQGTGKTLTSIAIMGRRFLRGEIKRVLIVAPTSVVPVWPTEFETHADFAVDCRALEGTVSRRIAQLQNWPRTGDVLQVALVNYESTWRMEDALKKWKPDMIVLDESQRIKSPRAKQSQAMHRLGEIARYRIILTGTPITNGPLDFFSQYKFLDPRIFGTSYYAFQAKYARIGGFSGHELIGHLNIQELIRKAHSVAFRVTKAAALDMPEQVDQIRYCELEPKAEKIYQQIAKECVAELEDEKTVTAANVLSRLLRLSQLTGGFVGDDDGEVQQASTAKLKLLEEVIDDLMEAGKKAVVFARFRPEIKAIREMLEKKKIGYTYIDGRVKNRGDVVKEFQENPDCRVFIGQIQAVREGLTLTASDTVIFYSMDYSYANYEQAKARIHRIGQKNTCTYIHLVARETVDEEIIGALAGKKNVADLVVDRWQTLFKGRDTHGEQRSVSAGG